MNGGTTNTTVKKIGVENQHSYGRAAYVNSAMYDANTLETYILEVYQAMTPSYPAEFPANILPTVIVNNVPLSLIDASVNIGTEVKGKKSYVDERANFEVNNILNNSFEINKSNNNEINYHKNEVNRRKLFEIIKNKIAPRNNRTFSNRDFKVLSGISFIVSDNQYLIRVLMGMYPDGTYKRKREFKDENLTEDDVNLKRMVLKDERFDELRRLNLTFSYKKYDYEEIRHIFFNMIYISRREHKEGVSVDDLKDAFDLTFTHARRFIESFLIRFVENSENIQESTDDFFQVISYAKGDTRNVLGETIRVFRQEIPIIVGEMLQAFSRVRVFLRNNNWIKSLMISLVKFIFEDQQLSSYYGTDTLNTKLKEGVRSFILSDALVDDFIGQIPVAEDTLKSFTVNYEAAEKFSKYGSEPIMSYIRRVYIGNTLEERCAEQYLFNFSQYFLTIEEARLQGGHGTKTSRKEYGINPESFLYDGSLQKLKFSVASLCEVAIKITGNDNSNIAEVKHVTDKMNDMNNKEDKIYTEIEKALYEEFGPSKIVQAIELPKLVVDSKSVTDIWFRDKLDNIKYEIKKILEYNEEYIRKARFDEMFEEMLEDFEEGNFEFNNENSKSDIYANLGDVKYEDLRSKMEKYKMYSDQENFQPKFSEFMIKTSDLQFGTTMQYWVTRLSIFVPVGNTYVSKKIEDIFFYKEDNQQVEKKVNPQGRIELINHFTNLFRFFGLSGGEINVTIESEYNKNFSGIERQEIKLYVDFATSEDAFVCSKFCTRMCTTSLDVMRMNGYPIDYDIPKDYIMSFNRTAEQQHQLAGINNEKTLKLYRESLGCEEKYPFISSALDIVNKEILSEFLNKTTNRANMVRAVPDDIFRFSNIGTRINSDTDYAGAVLTGTDIQNRIKYQKEDEGLSKIIAEVESRTVKAKTRSRDRNTQSPRRSPMVRSISPGSNYRSPSTSDRSGSGYSRDTRRSKYSKSPSDYSTKSKRVETPEPPENMEEIKRLQDDNFVIVKGKRRYRKKDITIKKTTIPKAFKKRSNSRDERPYTPVSDIDSTKDLYSPAQRWRNIESSQQFSTDVSSKVIKSIPKKPIDPINLRLEPEVSKVADMDFGLDDF